MKLVRVSLTLFALAWLSGCGTLGGTKDDAELEGVVVEDRSADSNGISDGSISGSDMGAEASVIAGGESYAGHSLDDPNSPLSNRIVYFEYDSSSVREEDQVTLQAHGAYLAENPNARVKLEGHTDERGSREYNLALGERRALAIRQILMIQGAGVDQFQVISFGEERPAVEGSTDAAWQNNRRVELIY